MLYNAHQERRLPTHRTRIATKCPDQFGKGGTLTPIRAGPTTRRSAQGLDFSQDANHVRSNRLVTFHSCPMVD